jgi:hypothetical protein
VAGNEFFVGLVFLIVAGFVVSGFCGASAWDDWYVVAGCAVF